jgi:phenylalanyl-tRNA synthetase beta chain
MKIPLDWLKEYIKTNKSKQELASSFTSLGLMLDKYTEGNILDLEHRMDRSDWLSIIGCARDLAAFENTDLLFPKLYTEKGKELPIEEQIKIEIKCPNKVNRFNTRIFKNIKVGESPKYIKDRLEMYGIPSINNIVDVTNYVMVELGQPMHAQDIAKLDAKEIIIRDAKKGEKITTLNGDTVELVEENAVLTQNDKATVIMGIVGGKETGVIETTKDIILDAGNYNQVFIRKASRKLKIQNETVMRCDKFLHPKLTEIALQRATQLILEIAGGEYYENQDCYPNKAEEKTQTIRLKRIEQLGGMKFEMDKVKNILNKLGYQITKENKEALEVTVPYFRTDVEVEDDIVADILRISDYANIPLQLIQSAPPKNITPEIYTFEDKLRDICINLGLHEHITDPIIQKGTQISGNSRKEIVLENALTSEKSALRTDIKQTLEGVLENYKKHKISKIGLFEIGTIYFEDPTDKTVAKYKEVKTLEIMYSNTSVTVKESSDEFKKLLNRLVRELKIEWGSVQKIWTITPYSVSIPTEQLLKLVKETTNTSKNIIDKVTTYTTEDFSIILSMNTKFGDIYNTIKTIDNNVIEVEVVEEYKINDTQKSILLRVTLDKSDTQDIRKAIIDKLKIGFNVDIRA